MDDPLDAAAPPSKARWAPDRTGFDSLLAALHPDRAEAADRYTALRDRLSRFFRWNRAGDPDTLADRTLDRLTRRVSTASGDDDAVREPEKFAAGIARMLLREQWREGKADAQMLVNLEQKSATLRVERLENERAETLSAIMEQCLASLAPDQRDLIQRYYSTESRTQIDARKTLAHEFGISLNALRNRAMRIRAEVERCARAHLDQPEIVINRPPTAHLYRAEDQ